MKKDVNMKRLRELARLLKNARTKSELTLRDVEAELKKAGVQFSFSNLAKLERAEYYRPKINAMIELAALLGLDPDHLVLLAEKIPSDVYWKIVNNPQLVKKIRRMKIV